MKKISNGEVYDTETARYIGGWDNKHCEQDYICEKLYCKRTGEYFLYGDGGPRTKYSKMEGYNTWVGGEMIIPLTYDKAKEWAEEHLKADDYLKEFEPIADNNNKINCSFYITGGTMEMLKKYARRQQKSMSECLENIIIDTVNK